MTPPDSGNQNSNGATVRNNSLRMLQSKHTVRATTMYSRVIAVYKKRLRGSTKKKISQIKPLDAHGRKAVGCFKDLSGDALCLLSEDWSAV